MGNKREYYKAFIILNQDIRGYSLSNKEPSGFCKIDAYGDRAKIQVSVQNLKPISEDRGYNLYLLANHKDGVRQVLLKSFCVDEKGKRDLKFDMNRENIGGSNLSIEEFEGVGILVEEDSYSLSPLIGFKKDPFIWKIAKNNIKTEKENKELDKADRKKEIKPSIDKKEIQEVNKSMEKEKEIRKEFKVEKEETELIKDAETKIEKEEIEIRKDLELEEKQKEIEEETLKEKEVVKEQEKEEENFKSIESYFTPNNRLWDFHREKPKKEDSLSKIINKSIRMNPFEKPDEDMEWYRISYEELPLILDYPWRWYANPYLLVGVKKYNHLLLGKNKELNTYCLGIPDIYFPRIKEEAKRFGCNTFLCCRDTKPAPGEYGYWIINLPL